MLSLPAMNLRPLVLALASSTALVLFAPACAEKESAEPPEIAVQVDFQSTAVALYTENVKIYVFDGALACNDLIRLRQTEQPLPARVVETPSLTPCQLLRNEQNALTLDLKKSYTMLAVGQVGGQDFVAGCSQQPAYGDNKAVDIVVSLIDDRQSIKPGGPACARLSDKCNGACR